jgi:hypothetical protein
MSEVLKSYLPKGIEAVKSALQKVNATGKTVNSIKGSTTDTSLTITGRPYIETIETGRGPRKSSTYGNFDKGLEEWLKAKGFSQKVSKKGTVYYQIGNQWFSAKSLAWKINKEGDKTFKSGQRKEVYSEAVSKFVEELTEAVTKDQKEQFKQKVIETLKNGTNSYQAA